MWFVTTAVGLSGILLGLALGFWVGVFSVCTTLEKQFDKGYYEHRGKFYTITKRDLKEILPKEEVECH